MLETDHKSVKILSFILNSVKELTAVKRRSSKVCDDVDDVHVNNDDAPL